LNFYVFVNEVHKGRWWIFWVECDGFWVRRWRL